MRRAALFALLALVAGCAGPQDVASEVHDLRVLGIQVQPPELMAASCNTDPSNAEAALVYFSPVTLTALIENPKDAATPIDYQLFACASQTDRTCEKDRVQLADGQTAPGEITLTVRPGAAGFDGTDFQSALLYKVVQQDPYKGLGGIRMPLVLHLEQGNEEIYAQKLMVFSCPFFPTMKPNQNPELPGLLLEGKAWGADEVRPLSGPGPFKVEPQPFADRQEHYVVPSYELQPVELDEAWKIAWYADLGQFSPEETGGADLGNAEGAHRVEWTPPKDAGEQDVRFWAVVRDGRGGSSWLMRRAHYKP